MAECHYGSGDVIYAADLERLRTEDCTIEAGASIRLYYTDEPSEGSGGVPKAGTRKATRFSMDETNTEASGALAPVAVPVAAPLPGVASVEHTSGAPFDVAALSNAAGQNGGIAVILALLAVVGGAAGWKFWTKISEQKHEQAMKVLELRAATAATQQDKSPSQCTAAHAGFDTRIGSLEQRIAALDGKVSSVEQKSLNLDPGFDPSTFKKRLDKVEKQLRAKKP